MRKAIFVALSFLLACGLSPRLWAQNPVSGGSVSGIVTDTSGGAVVGATVTLTNVSTGVQSTTKTNGSGIFTFPVLSVGTYSVSLAKEGFKTTEVKDVVVEVGQTSSVNVSLEVGALSQSVTVTVSAPLLRPTESTISTVVDQKLIEELPVNGRRYTDFVLLTPNVNADGDFGDVSVGGQQGSADSGYANGNGSNSYTVDGANFTSNFFGQARGRTRVPYIFGLQSIQEFQVADSPYSAAYGSAGTGFINTVTKSGTDTFHGGAFYYNRNSGTGSNDPVDHANGVPRLLNVLQQFGADLGGPVAQHKAWFYFDYEQQRQLNPISVANAGFAAVTQASFDNASGQTLPAPNADFPVASLLFNTAPMPGDPNFPIYLQQVSNALNAFHRNLKPRSRRRDDLVFFPKLDWQPTNADHLTFVYNYNRFNSPGGAITFNPDSFFGDDALPNSFVRDHHASVHWARTLTSTLLNDLHVSFLRDEQIGTTSGIVKPNAPDVFVAMLTLGGNGFSDMLFGNPNFAKDDGKEYQWEIGEQVNYVHGRHNFKFGFDFDRTRQIEFSPGDNFGNYSFFLFSAGSIPNATNFALGNYGNFSQNGGNPVFGFSVPYFGFYVQDKFQASKKLTLDLGLREDFQIYPQPAGNPAFPLTSHFPNQYQRLSPRLGFAYQPCSDGKTVVRGGFGMFYDIFNGINYKSAVINNGLPAQQSSFFARRGNPGAPSFPNPVPNSGFTASSNISLVDPGFKTPYVLQSSLEIQREILHNTTVTVGTMWTHGVHLIASSAFDLNLNLPPTGMTTYIVCPAGAGADAGHPVSMAVCTGPTFHGPTLDAGQLSEGRISSTFNQIDALISPGVNNYNSLYVQIQRRVSQGLSLQLGYTLSKTLQSHGADFFNQFDFSGTKGPSLLDQRHRLSIASVYAPDASHLSSEAARVLLSNWTISTVMQFSSGRPYTAELTAACSALDFNDCPPSSAGENNNVNNSAFNESLISAAGLAGGLGPSPTVGLNAFYGPWIQEIDLGIARSFHITERHRIAFQVQAFNLFNRPNFFVQNGGGISQVKYDPIGTNCGDGASASQTCFLVPDSGFQRLSGSINELNGPRILQFGFSWKF